MNDLATELGAANECQLREMVRQAESYLQSQLTASIAADQRAISFASVLAAATVVVVGGSAVVFYGQAGAPSILGWAGMLVSIGFLASMYLAIKAAMPATFEFAGNTPESWRNDVKDKLEFNKSIAEQAAWYTDMISFNNELMRKNNKQMEWSISAAWGSIAVGIAVVFFVLLYDVVFGANGGNGALAAQACVA